MKPTFRLLLLLLLALSPIPLVPSSARPQTQAEDEAALRAIVTAANDTFARRDADGYLRLWSAKAPGMAARRQSLKFMFGVIGRVEVRSIEIRKVTVEGDSGQVFYAHERLAYYAGSGKPVPGFGKGRQTFSCVREADGWKIVKESTPEDALAAAVAAAKTDEERRAIIAADPEVAQFTLTAVLNQEANALLRKEQADAAFALFNFARRQAEGAGDARAASYVCLEAGMGRYLRGQVEESLALFRQALPVMEAAEDPVGIARAAYGVGECLRSLDETEQALPYVEKAVKYGEQVHHDWILANGLNVLGECHRLRGDYDEAIACYERCLPIARAAGIQWLVGYALNNRGIALELKGDLPAGLRSLQEALALRREMGDKRTIGDSLNNLGAFYWRERDLPLALDYFQQGLAIRREIGYKAGVASGTMNVAVARAGLGMREEAIRNYQASLAMWEELKDDRLVALTAINLGSLYAGGREFAKATPLYQRALPILERLNDRPLLSELHMLMADERLRTEDNDGALRLASRGVALAQKCSNRFFAAKCHGIAGRAYIRTGKLEEAERELNQAIAESEAERSGVIGDEGVRANAFRELTSPFGLMAHIRVLQKRPAEALAYAERVKARTLLEILQGGRADIVHAMTPAEQAEERRLRTELAAVNARLVRENVREQSDRAEVARLEQGRAKVQRDLDAFRIGLYVAHPRLRAQRGEAKVLTLHEAGSLLPDDRSAILSFLVLEDTTYLFVLTRDSAQDLLPALRVYGMRIWDDDLAKRVGAFRARVSDPNHAVSEEAAALYKLLIAPAAQQLRDRSRLVIVPDGPLWELPFQALQPRTGRFLLQDHVISYAPSLTALREMRTLRERRMARAGSKEVLNTLLAVGNPSLGEASAQTTQVAHRGGRFAPLPESEREVKELERIYGAEHCRAYVGDQAQEARIKAEAARYRVLHFATHGVLDNASPLNSYILLSQAQNPPDEDGLLDAREIMDLDLKADLVVLSACETARGDIKQGEGVVGLSWALFVAGCPAAVVSQWKVPASSTTPLMLAFHKGLHAGRHTADALRTAALAVLKEPGHEHPFYWAGFVVVGDGQ